MKSHRILFLAAPLLLPASSWGQDVYGYQDYTVRICNRGQLAIDVATGFQDSSLGSEWWVIDRWLHVNPGNCEVVSSRHLSIPDGLLGRSRFAEDHLHLAFAFTDSTGVWGAGMVNPNETNARIGNQDIEKKYLKPSNRRFCIHPGDSKYRVDGQDPSAGCGGTGTFLVPASIDYAAIPDWDLKTAFVDNYPTTFDVGFGPQDRAIPMGSGPKQEVSSGPGTVQDFQNLLDDVIRGPGAPALRVTASDRWFDVCIPPSVLKKQSWADPQTARALTLKAAIRQFVAAHTFTLSRSGTLRVTEPAGKFAIEEVKECGSDEFDFSLHGPDDSLQWVRDNLVGYIDASKTGFAAYKKGTGQISRGYRMWDSSVKPAQAKGCWVVQGTTSTTLSCLLSQQTDLNGLRSYYTELTKDIAASLPRDWKTQAEPPFGGDLPNQGYQSSSGTHLEVWIAHAESGAEYQIHFQLVSAH